MEHAAARHAGATLSMTTWIIVSAMLFVAAAIGIAMVLAIVRDVQADKRDLGGKGAERSKRIDLFGRRDEDDPA